MPILLSNLNDVAFTICGTMENRKFTPIQERVFTIHKFDWLYFLHLHFIGLIILHFQWNDSYPPVIVMTHDYAQEERPSTNLSFLFFV
jgi:hypothetical protein